jgi:hypothetical protein
MRLAGASTLKCEKSHASDREVSRTVSTETRIVSTPTRGALTVIYDFSTKQCSNPYTLQTIRR